MVSNSMGQPRVLTRDTLDRPAQILHERRVGPNQRRERHTNRHGAKIHALDFGNRTRKL